MQFRIRAAPLVVHFAIHTPGNICAPDPTMRWHGIFREHSKRLREQLGLAKQARQLAQEQSRMLNRVDLNKLMQSVSIYFERETSKER